MEITEGKAKFSPGKQFYNPHMRFCRDIISLAISALPEKQLELLDGFTASGIRGIRYVLESKKISTATFLDMDENAKKTIQGNLKKNGLKAKVAIEDFNRFVRTIGKRFDFVEIDPFGSSLPFLDAGIYSLGRKGYLSVTATDTQVLCGSNKDACRKYYLARSLNNYFCHETSLRVLLHTIARKAAEQNKGIVPLLSVARRHYVKILVRIGDSEGKARESVEQIGHAHYCRNCCWSGKFELGEQASCQNCGSKTIVLGPLWLGKIQDRKLLENMLENLKKSDHFEKPWELEKAITLMMNDNLSLFFYDIHDLCKAMTKPMRSNEYVLGKLREKGFTAELCQFSPTGIKGDFNHKDFCEAL